LHALNHLVSDLLVASTALLSGQPKLYLIDSKPISVCHPLRHGRVRLMREDGAHFGKTKKGWFFGFKLHALRQVAGRVVNLILTPANMDDRVPAPDLLMAADGGITIGDLGYRGKESQDLLIEEIEEAEMLMLTRADATEWSAPGKLEKVSHRFRTGRSAGFMFRTAASNSAGGT